MGLAAALCHATLRTSSTAALIDLRRVRTRRLGGDMRVKDAVGRFGEQVAAAHLESVGMEVLDRNWRCRDGEIDLVACDGDDLVFVEVKTRSSLAYGSPAEALSRAKTARIRKLSMRWLAARADTGGDDHRHWRTIRFDVVSVLRRRDGGPEITHVRGAF